MEPQARRERMRMIVGEELTAVSRRHQRGFCPNGKSVVCDHGSAWTARELDGIAYVFWKVGRSDNDGNRVGGAHDGDPL
jgi:hypothetical protein